MTTEQTAQQLELAAQILRTGHPWGYRHIAGSRYKYNTPIEVVADGNFLSPLLATPPDNRPLHNPDNLTAEQVGVGYRLALPGESAASPHDFWDGNTWKKAELRGPAIFAWCCRSCRLPLSVPWPEPEKPDPYAELKAAHAAGKVIQWFNGTTWIDLIKPVDPNPLWLHPAKDLRIKPDEPAFQLPPCAPGMRWHREDGWRPEDLPSGYRPLVDGESWVAGDEILRFAPSGWQIGGKPGDVLDKPTHSGTSRCRTTRPLVFNHAGKTWTYHRPGDPMPCESGKRLEIIYESQEDDSRPEFTIDDRLDASCVNWKANTSVIGWRYADEKKTVPLGPEDVRCGDEITIDEYDDVRRQVLAVESTHIHLSVYGRIDYETLRKRQAKIRRRDSNEFVPCSKQIPV